MYHKVTPYFPMKQVFGTPKCKKIHRLPLDLVVRLERKPTRADFLCRQFRGHTKYLPNNSLGDLKSLPRKSEIHRKFEIKLRKNEMKLRKNEIKLRKNEMKLRKNEIKLRKNEMKLRKNEMCCFRVV